MRPNRAALKRKPIWFGAMCSGSAIAGAAAPMARRSNPSSSATRPHSTMILICNGPRGYRSISSVMLTEEDTDISSAPLCSRNRAIAGRATHRGRAGHGPLVFPRDGVDAGRIRAGHHLPMIHLVCRVGLSRFRQGLPLRHSFIDGNR